MSARANLWTMWFNIGAIIINLLGLNYAQFTFDWAMGAGAGYCLCAAIWCYGDYRKAKT